MASIIEFLKEPHERTVTIFGVMFVALGLFSPPTGITQALIKEYGLRPDYWAIAIIVGMFVKVLSSGRILMRLIGIMPYTIYILLANSLWVRGVTGLLQSQILYVLIWFILVQPLTRDIVDTLIHKGERNAAKVN